MHWQPPSQCNLVATTHWYSWRCFSKPPWPQLTLTLQTLQCCWQQSNLLWKSLGAVCSDGDKAGHPADPPSYTSKWNKNFTMMEDSQHCSFAVSLVTSRAKLAEGMFHNLFFLYELWYGRIQSLWKSVVFCPKSILMTLVYYLHWTGNKCFLLSHKFINSLIRCCVREIWKWC